MKHPDAKLSLVAAALLGAVLFTAPLAATRCKYVWEDSIQVTLGILYPNTAITSVFSAPAEAPDANAAPALPGTVESSPAGEALSPDTGTIPEKTGEAPLPAGEEPSDPEEQPSEETNPEEPLEENSLPPEEEPPKGTDSALEEQPPEESVPTLEDQPPEETTPAPSA